MATQRELFEINGRISDDLYEWLSARERYIKVRDAFYEDGGHIMLKRELFDPEALSEPLKAEAVEYFKKRKTKRGGET